MSRAEFSRVREHGQKHKEDHNVAENDPRVHVRDRGRKALGRLDVLEYVHDCVFVRCSSNERHFRLHHAGLHLQAAKGLSVRLGFQHFHAEHAQHLLHRRVYAVCKIHRLGRQVELLKDRRALSLNSRVLHVLIDDPPPPPVAVRLIIGRGFSGLPVVCDPLKLVYCLCPLALLHVRERTHPSPPLPVPTPLLRLPGALLLLLLYLPLRQQQRALEPIVCGPREAHLLFVLIYLVCGKAGVLVAAIDLPSLLAAEQKSRRCEVLNLSPRGGDGEATAEVYGVDHVFPRVDFAQGFSVFPVRQLPGNLVQLVEILSLHEPLVHVSAACHNWRKILGIKRRHNVVSRLTPGANRPPLRIVEFEGVVRLHAQFCRDQRDLAAADHRQLDGTLDAEVVIHREVADGEARRVEGQAVLADPVNLHNAHLGGIVPCRQDDDLFVQLVLLAGPLVPPHAPVVGPILCRGLRHDDGPFEETFELVHGNCPRAVHIDRPVQLAHISHLPIRGSMSARLFSARALSSRFARAGLERGTRVPPQARLAGLPGPGGAWG